MKVAVIGATGTIGKAVSDLLREEDHQVIKASRNTNPPINIDRPNSIEQFYRQINTVDAVICAAGNASFGSLQDLRDKQFEIGLNSKLMGQVNVVRRGLELLDGSTVYVLTSGMLSHSPWPGTSAVSMVNAGLESFVQAASLDLKDQDDRVCVVSPPLIKETAKRMKQQDPEPWPEASVVAQAYLKALEGDASGDTLYVEGYEPE
jgi:NAD(P)-dependent dehydrogenase (short-subunit alcohol dehydrogenase family)